MLEPGTGIIAASPDPLLYLRARLNYAYNTCIIIIRSGEYNLEFEVPFILLNPHKYSTFWLDLPLKPPLHAIYL